MHVPPQSELMSSFGVAKQIPEYQFFSIVNLDDGPKTQPTDILRSFAAEASAVYSNIQFGRSRPSVQSGTRTQSGAEQGIPRFGSFAGNIGGSTVQIQKVISNIVFKN